MRPAGNVSVSPAVGAELLEIAGARLVRSH
jgi:hypothetical protein